jgi:hypothetical protein
MYIQYKVFSVEGIVPVGFTGIYLLSWIFVNIIIKPQLAFSGAKVESNSSADSMIITQKKNSRKGSVREGLVRRSRYIQGRVPCCRQVNFDLPVTNFSDK